MICALEVAAMCGVGSSAVSNWKARHDDFPEPIYQYGDVKIYSRPAMLGWLALHGKSA